MPSVLWRGASLESLEFADLSPVAGGHRLSGMLLAPVEGRPTHLVYQVDVDEGWRTRIVRVTLFEAGGPRTLVAAADGEGRWEVDGVAAGDLDGCLDADLRWTPATNTLPIRRLAHDVALGEATAVSAAWFGFPDLRVERLDQTYLRLADDRWRYAAGDYTADLRVDEDGIVLEYADEWRAVAHSDPNRLRREG